jgi:DNA-binding MarR family transcriptional regulator
MSDSGQRQQHPRHALDEVIHSPVRLSIVSVLAAAGETDFRFLREQLEISDSLLSKHGAQLEAAGYVRIVKGFVGKRPSTWYILTDEGHTAFVRYQRTLRAILDGSAAGTGEPGGPVASSAVASSPVPSDPAPSRPVPSRPVPSDPVRRAPTGR